MLCKNQWHKTDKSNKRLLGRMESAVRVISLSQAIQLMGFDSLKNLGSNHPTDLLTYSTDFSHFLQNSITMLI